MDVPTAAGPLAPNARPAAHAGAAARMPDAGLRKAAMALESEFLVEMLKSAGLGKPRESFGGGIGEEQFASFLQREQADAMVAAGGIGLAETIYHAMARRTE